MSNIEGMKKTETPHFDIFRMEVYDVLKHGRVPEKIIEEKQKENSNKPFIFFADIIHNLTGTSDGRRWIPYLGNIHIYIGFPHKYFKTYLEDYAFAVLASKVVHQIYDKYAPGEYFVKFLNDIICKHGHKNVGILTRHHQDWQYVIYAGNVVDHPPDELLRKDGLTACHLLAHCKTDAKAFDIGVEIAELLYSELIDGYEPIECFQWYLDNIRKNPFNKVLFIYNDKATYPEVKRVVGGAYEQGFCQVYKSGKQDDEPFDDEGSFYVDYVFEPYPEE